MDVIQQEAGTWQRLTGSTNGHTALCPPHGHPKPLLELVPSPKATLWINFTIQGKTTPSSQEPAKSTQGPTAGSDKGQPPGAPGHPVLWPLRLLQSPFFPCAPGPLVGVGFLLRVWAPQLPSLIRISKALAPGLCLPVLFLLAACPLPAEIHRRGWLSRSSGGGFRGAPRPRPPLGRHRDGGGQGGRWPATTAPGLGRPTVLSCFISAMPASVPPLYREGDRHGNVWEKKVPTFPVSWKELNLEGLWLTLHCQSPVPRALCCASFSTVVFW